MPRPVRGGRDPRGRVLMTAPRMCRKLRFDPSRTNLRRSRHAPCRAPVDRRRLLRSRHPDRACARVMGLGAAMIMPTTLSIITGTFSAGTRDTAPSGVWAGVAGGSALVGPARLRRCCSSGSTGRRCSASTPRSPPIGGAMPLRLVARNRRELVLAPGSGPARGGDARPSGTARLYVLALPGHGATQRARHTRGYDGGSRRGDARKCRVGLSAASRRAPATADRAIRAYGRRS